MKKILFTLLLGFAMIVPMVWTQTGKDAGKEMAEGVRHFLTSLTQEQRSSVTFPLTDEERFNWHFTPRERKGVAFKQMTPAQQKLAHALLITGLSHDGYIKATGIMYLDQILYEIQQRSIRDPDLYFFTIFGEPSATGDWGWRVEGHHLSLNFTIRNGRLVSGTPSFFGSNPARVQQGPHAGLRVLAAEEDMGRQLMKLFNGSQQKKVIIAADAPADIITGNSRKAQLGDPVGLPLSAMTKEQATRLMGLVEMYAHRLRPELAEADLAKLRKAGVEKIHFAWAGGSEPGQPHYYRIQGPTFVIEYDKTQDNANHIHSVWRDFDGDFGLDLLREHYERSQHHNQDHRPARPNR